MFEDILRQSLHRALRAKLSSAVQLGHQHNVIVEKEKVDELLTKAAQPPADRVRGLVIFAIVDDEDKKGYTFESLISGTPNVLGPLVEFGAEELEMKLEESAKKTKSGPCPDCGEVHDSAEDFLDELLRRGPGSSFKTSPPVRNELDGLLGLLDLLAKR